MKPLRITPSVTGSRALASRGIPAQILKAVTIISSLALGLTLAQQSVKPVNVADKNSLALPLASVGSSVGWKIGPEDYRLNVPAAARGRQTSLEVFSPEINRNDYANGRNRTTYYGDELYGKTAKLETTFKLSTPGSTELVRRVFTVGSKHSFVQLYTGVLEPGVYPLNVLSVGNGKNAFQLRASAGVRVEASQFTVNARGANNRDQLVAFLDVGKSAVGKTVRLENYDADGANELVLTLVDPQGRRRAMSISGDTRWAGDAIKVSNNLVGTWKILARILPTTKQFSNAVAFRFRVDDQPLFARIPGFNAPAGQPTPPITQPIAKGTLTVNASTVTCGLKSPLESGFKLNGTRYTTPANLSLELGEYTLLPDAVPGSKTDPVMVTVKDGAQSATLEYKVITNLKLEPQTLSLEVGQTVTITATASTAFSNAVPATIALELPDGLEALSPVRFEGQILSTKALSLTVSVRATNTVQDGVLRASLGSNCAPSETRVNISASNPAKLTLEKTVDRMEAKPGEAVNYTVIVTNTGGETASGVQLKDALPQGLEGDNFAATLDLKPGERRAFTVSATVSLSASGTITNTARLTWNGETLAADASLQIAPTPTAPNLTLEKTVDRSKIHVGDLVNFTITARNTGDGAARGVRVSDELPEGLEGQKLLETFDLEPGASRAFTVPATVSKGANGEITNAATLTWQDTKRTASASVQVEPAPTPLAQLRLEKTVDRTTARPGERVNFTVTVTNAGGELAKGVQLTDALPMGLTGSDVAETFDLEPGASKTFTVPGTVNAKDGTLENTAQIVWNAQTLSSSASVNVTPIQQGALLVNAVAMLCGTETVLENAAFTINGQTYNAPASIKLDPGEYTLEPAALPGSSVQAVKVKMLEGQDANVALEYRPVITLKLEPKSLALKLGETTTLTATASTEFPFALPTRIALEIPDGLKFDGETRLEGKVSKDQALTLSVPVRALKPVKGEITASLEPKCGVNASASLEIMVNVLPPETRESELIVLTKLGVTPKGSVVVISDRLPQNARYIPGSSRILKNVQLGANAQPTTGLWTPNPDQKTDPLDDPFVSGDRLFWVIPADRLPVSLRSRLQRTPSGTVFSRASLNALGIVYRVAHDGPITVPRDPAAILVQPNARPIRTNVSVKFDPASAVGKLVGLGDARVLEGDPNVLEIFAKAVPFGSSEIAATPPAPTIGGPASSLKVRAVRVTTDAADQPELIIEAFDKDGQPANDAFVTLELNVEPLTPDAAPDQSGYQVKLLNGAGRIRIGTPSSQEGANAQFPSITVEARVTNVNGTISSSGRFRVDELSLNAPNPLEPNTTPVTASLRPFVLVGIGTAQFNLGGTAPFSASGALRGFARGTVFEDWLLTAGINWQANYDGSSLALSGDLLPPADPFERFPLLGDSSIGGSDARSSEGLYLRLERGPSYAMYGQINPGFRGLLSSYNANYNGLQVLARDGLGYNLNAFAALVPNASQRFSARGDGTSFYRLPNAPIEPSSERIVIAVYDRNNPSLKLETRALTRLADYTLDTVSGAIQLTRPLASSDANGNAQFLEVDYATTAEAAPRELRFGVQGTLGSSDGFSVAVTALNYRPGPNPLYLFGIGAAFRADSLQIGVEGTFSGQPGNGGGLGLAAQLNYTLEGFQVQARYQELWPGYLDPSSSSTTPTSQTGRAFQLGAGAKLSDTFSINAALTHNQNFLTGQADTSGGLEARNDFGVLSALLGLYGRYSNVSLTSSGLPVNVGGFVTAGLEIPLGAFKFGAVQRVPLTPGTYGETELSLDYAITPAFGIRFTDSLTFEPNGVRQQLSLGARGTFSNRELIRNLTGTSGDDATDTQNGTPDAFGATNISASYELTTLSGASGRARVGLDTNIPLGSNWSTQIGGEALFDPASTTTGSASVGFLYGDQRLKGSTRVQLGFTPDGLKQVYTLGAVIQIDPTLVFSPSLEYTALPKFEPLPSGSSVRDGGRFSIAAAWRADDVSVLTNHAGRFGVYAPGGDELRGEVQFGYVGFERWFLRAGAAYKLTGGVFTGQFGAGTTYYFTDTLGAGAQFAYLFQPVTGSSSLSFGLEASLRVLPGFTLTGGFNFLGFASPFSSTTAPGFYLRFDFLFDDGWFGTR